MSEARRLRDTTQPAGSGEPTGTAQPIEKARWRQILDPRKRSVNRLLVVAGFASTLLYAAIAGLSWQFGIHTEGVDRPIIAVLLLFAATFAVYLMVIACVQRMRADRTTTRIIVSAAILFRVVMLFSLPIQEVDLYRYLWDGAVCVEGVSPFAYRPETVKQAATSSTDDPRLDRLINLLNREPAMAEILDRVHFPELPSIYPPTSQAVFGAVGLATPSNASVLTRVFILKAWLIVFDLATLWVIIALLRLASKPAELCVIYAWCPLLMKEVANSGHLDAIAVFLTTLAVYLLAFSLSSRRKIISSIAAFVLALAVAAKLYPLVLVPIFTACSLMRNGYRTTIATAIVFIFTAALLLVPMLPSSNQAHDPSLGVVTFLRQWEMNDFLFLNIVENLKPNSQRAASEIAWFTIVPDNLRVHFVETMSSRLNLPKAQAPFLFTRALTSAIFLLVALAIAWRFSASNPAGSGNVSRLAEGVFLTLAWFWLLCPTQNPWYWTWALPLLPFVRSRLWVAVSGLTMLYYLRFWLLYHYPSSTVFGSPYHGATFFDFVVTWIEFGPWFVCLAVSSLNRLKDLST